MKKFLILLLVLLLPVSALADPLQLLDEDLTGIISESNYVYSYRYPQANPSDPNAAHINTFFSELVRDAVDMQVPSAAQDYANSGNSLSVVITYEVTLSNDEFFSVRIRSSCSYEDADGEIINYETWKGYTFSLFEGMTGQTSTLSHILGILNSEETDEWLEERQESKVYDAVLSLVWKRIQENTEENEYYSGLTIEDLDFFNPDTDFWLDETGNPVFYIEFYIQNENDEERWEKVLLTFPITLEEIDDEI